jgi:hypothetical protein
MMPMAPRRGDVFRDEEAVVTHLAGHPWEEHHGSADTVGEGSPPDAHDDNGGDQHAAG